MTQTRSSNWLLLAALLLAGMTFLAFRALAIIAPSIHPSITHGYDSDQARNCLNNNGPQRAFQERDGTIHLLCQGDHWYDVIIKNDKGWVEKSSFTPKDGTLNSILKWLSQKNVKPVDLSQFRELKFPY